MGEHEGEPEIGYWIARDHWGCGYATEAAGAVLKIARALGHRRVVAGHFIDNPASGKVLRKLGFAPTGQPGKRFSVARGGQVDAIEYAINLEADLDPAPFARAA
jgi:RimJ/RimL family protein N-acetyltransferase